MRRSTKKAMVAVGLTVAAVGGGVGIASAAGGAGSGGSRLDDGKQYLSQAKVSEADAIAAAKHAASGGLNEVDLEHYQGRLVWNVDVGSKDVKVDAETGEVLGSSSDD